MWISLSSHSNRIAFIRSTEFALQMKTRYDLGLTVSSIHDLSYIWRVAPIILSKHCFASNWKSSCQFGNFILIFFSPISFPWGSARRSILISLFLNLNVWVSNNLKVLLIRASFFTWPSTKRLLVAVFQFDSFWKQDKVYKADECLKDAPVALDMLLKIQTKGIGSSTDPREHCLQKLSAHLRHLQQRCCWSSCFQKKTLNHFTSCGYNITTIHRQPFFDTVTFWPFWFNESLESRSERRPLTTHPISTADHLFLDRFQNGPSSTGSFSNDLQASRRVRTKFSSTRL